MGIIPDNRTKAGSNWASQRLMRTAIFAKRKAKKAQQESDRHVINRIRR